MEESKKMNNKVVNVIAGVIIGIIIGAVIVFVLFKSEILKVSNAENDTTKTQNSISQLTGDFYILNDQMMSSKRRYYLVFDNPEYGLSVNFMNKQAYILDMKFSNKEQILTKVDLSNLLKSYYDSVVSNYNGSIQKSKCTFTTAFYDGTEDVTGWGISIDWAKEIPFKVSYNCAYSTENNGTINAELSIKNELYKFNTETNKITLLKSE